MVVTSPHPVSAAARPNTSAPATPAAVPRRLGDPPISARPLLAFRPAQRPDLLLHLM
ncbi:MULTISPECIES: hypothetical protein [unclassified Streptomyces]|uniref:hypothetical protein n=1 Tax=unclassified Streptomyces TaxID=2593676 RepID=UPI0013B8ACAC|nr:MULTISPECIES: hypothetical protein [unclassified Streptomyces]NEC06218.1 hypothetical protein [Streptomyces sp. SID7909]